jgi:SAM-dependent methyltransferase
MLKRWLENIYNKLSKYRHYYFGVRPINVAQVDIATWFSSALGQRVLQAEKKHINKLLEDMFGYHLMQLSVLSGTDLLQGCPITHHFSVLPYNTKDATQSYVRADFEHLPIDSNTVDMALLHHALDFSLNPHQLLRETSRVVMPNGHIVLVGFNPWSLMGAMTPFASILSPSHFYRRNHLRLARLKDWCKVLELELVYSDKGYFGLPCQRDFLPMLDTVGSNVYRPLGGFYILVLRKNVTPMTIIKTAWKNKKVMPKWRKGIATSSISQQSSLDKNTTE